MEEAKALKIKYFNCPRKGQHDGQALNYVCIDSKCDRRGLLCSICRSANHTNHNMVPLKILLEKLKYHQQQPMQSQNFQDHIGSIETIRNEILYELRLCVEDIAEKFREVQKQIIDDFTKIKVELLQQIQLNLKFDAIINSALQSQLEDQQAFTQDMARIASLIQSTDLKRNLTFEINLTKIVHNYSNCRKEIGSLLEKVQENMGTLLNLKNITTDSIKHSDQKTELKDLFNEAQPPSQILSDQKYTFSTKHKGSGVKLDKNNKAAKQTITSTERFALVNEGLGVKHQKISFKVVSLKNWVGFGISIRNSIQKQKYNFNYSSMGHGSYLLSSNGFTWSHTQKGDNIIDKKFTFKEGDTVQVQLKETQLTFKRKSSPETLSIKLAIKPEEWPHVGFCVNLCSIDDAVQIVD